VGRDALRLAPHLGSESADLAGGADIDVYVCDPSVALRPLRVAIIATDPLSDLRSLPEVVKGRIYRTQCVRDPASRMR
jgi:hypothetical protein